MAAILPFLEQQDDPAETPEQTDALTSRPGTVQGLGRAAASETESFVEASVNPDALDQSHSQLVFTAWQRNAIYEMLEKATFTVRYGDKDGTQRRDVWLVLDKPVGAYIPEGAMAWSPPSNRKIGQARLLSWTSKMSAPSFSLPAGSSVIGGSCPGATAAQSVNGLRVIRDTSKHVLDVLGRPVELDRAICQHCYAEGGQYSTANVQFYQVLRFAWATRAVRDGSFVDVMSYAVANADYKLKDERHPGRYFRIHDSGDFYSLEYLAAWREVAARFPDILFWAPTRIWATKWGHRATEIMRPRPGVPDNLILRPSAYHINEHVPSAAELGPGWAAGTTVFSDASSDGGPSPKYAGMQQRVFDWDCGVYAIDNKKATCRNAIAPDNKKGCRACWRFPDQVVNYTLH